MISLGQKLEKQVIDLITVHTPIVDPFPIEDPSLKIQIEDLFLFSKKWVLGKNLIRRPPKSLTRK